MKAIVERGAIWFRRGILDDMKLGGSLRGAASSEVALG